MSGKEVKIICVLKRSPFFDVDYVEHLRRQVEYHMPEQQLHCISNVELKMPGYIPMERMYPKWWSKMELFRPDIEGDLLFLDLDTIICSPIRDMLDVGRLTMLTDFYKPQRLASGFMYIPHEDKEIVWKTFIKRSREIMAQYSRGGDQEFLAAVWGEKPRRWQDMFPKRVISYKAHKVMMNGVNPRKHSVLCFHGRPKPRDVKWQVRGLPELPNQLPR